MAKWRINGKTKLTGIIGYPLEYTLSPVVHNAAFRSLNLNWCYLPLLVERKNLLNALDGLKSLSFVGVNVTMPYKEAVVPYIDEMVSSAKIVEAVNTIHVQKEKLVGYNTDGQGFLISLQKDLGFDPKRKNILLVGAGGAARSVAITLASIGIGHLTIMNRTKERAVELYQLVKESFPDCQVKFLGLDEDLAEAFGAADLIINATPVGMSPEREEVPFPVEFIRERHLVFDLIYKPLETLLLKVAKEKGAQILNGLGMLLYQAAASFEIWTGIEPPIDIMRAALQEELGKP